jgi:hypothetical protein
LKVALNFADLYFLNTHYMQCIVINNFLQVKFSFAEILNIRDFPYK